MTMRCRLGHAPAAYLGSRPSSDSLQVQPGPSWRGLLLTPDHPPSWLQALLSHLQGRPDAALAQQARQLVVSLLSVTLMIAAVAAVMVTVTTLKAAHGCVTYGVVFAVVTFTLSHQLSWSKMSRSHVEALCVHRQHVERQMPGN